jgi:hypothetical protein
MKIDVSNGELADKLSILEIKASRIDDPIKLQNINKELKHIQEAALKILAECKSEYTKLKEINESLWDIENAIREFERNQDFEQEFIETARKVYMLNDVRAALKKEINIITKSDLSEEKSYAGY